MLGTASLDALQKFAGKFRSAQAAVMGRFGRAASKPMCELITEVGAVFPKAMNGRIMLRAGVLPIISPRLIMSSTQENSPSPVGI